jgi:hypothetical protein
MKMKFSKLWQNIVRVAKAGLAAFESILSPNRFREELSEENAEKKDV